jgi:hypothetical protein
MASGSRGHGGVAVASNEIHYGYVVYQLVASLLGAFAIAEFVKHFVHIDWHGMLAVQAAIWNVSIAPVQNLVFGWMEKSTGEHFEPFWRDYLTVGAVVLLSFARASMAYDVSSANNQLLRWGEIFLDLVTHVLLWPLAFLKALLGVFEKDPEHAPYVILLTLTPFLYLAILFGVNAWLS